MKSAHSVSAKSDTKKPNNLKKTALETAERFREATTQANGIANFLYSKALQTHAEIGKAESSEPEELQARRDHLNKMATLWKLTARTIEVGFFAFHDAAENNNELAQEFLREWPGVEELFWRSDVWEAPLPGVQLDINKLFRTAFAVPHYAPATERYHSSVSPMKPDAPVASRTVGQFNATTFTIVIGEHVDPEDVPQGFFGNKRSQKGDMLIFDYALTPEPGEYVLVASGARRTVCVYMERDNCAELKPVNEGLAFNLWAYPIGVTPEKGKTVGTILGTLVGSAARGSLRSFAGL